MQIVKHPWVWGQLQGSDLYKVNQEVKGEWAIEVNGEWLYGAWEKEDLENALIVRPTRSFKKYV